MKEKAVVSNDSFLHIGGKMEELEIKSSYEYPSNALSNFYPHSFTLDGVDCASMEGFLQSLKYKNPKKQRKICTYTGLEAKKKGKFKFMWKLTGNVYWQGNKINRLSSEFQTLINRAYEAMFKNDNFKKALFDSKGYELSHKIGKQDPKKTILTENEFLSILNNLRNTL